MTIALALLISSFISPMCVCIYKADSEPSDADDLDGIPHSKPKSGKPKKRKEPKLGDKMSSDDEFPSEDGSGGAADDEPEEKPLGLTGKKKPRRKSPKLHGEDKSPEDVPFIIPLLTTLISFIGTTVYIL